MTAVFDTNFAGAPPKFTDEQKAALLSGQAVHVNGVAFSLAHYLEQGAKLYGPPRAAGANAFAAYSADPATWRAAAAKVGKKMGKKPGELEAELGYDLLDQLISIVNEAR